MNDKNISISHRLASLLALVTGIFVYGILLAISLPQSFGLAFRYDATYVSLLAVLVFFLVFRLKGWKSEYAAAIAVLAFFALPLAGMWGSCVRDSYILGSLLPTGDATRFYLDATRLLEGWAFDSSGWRPLYPAFLSGLLWLTGQNLQIAMALQGVLVATACYLSAREVQRTHGAAAAAVFLTLLFLYSRRFSGTTMTENLGLLLGAIGLALLWRAANQQKLLNAVFAVLMVSLALFARPGCYFILPALILWTGWAWRGERRLSWRAIMLTLAAILLAYMLNSGMASLLTAGGEKQSNFDLTLYGQVSGGLGWNQVHVDHPEVRLLPEPEHSERVYELAFDLFKQQPQLLLQATFKSWGAFFSTAEEGIFGFVGKENSMTTMPLRLMLYGLSLIGLAGLFNSARNASASAGEKTAAGLLLALLVGAFLSVPFVPPWDGPGMRLYAASLALFALLPGLGAAALAGRIPFLPSTQPADDSDNALFVYSLPVCLLLVVLPLFIHMTTGRTEIGETDCPVEMDAVTVRVLPGSIIDIVADDEVQRTRLPQIRQSEFTLSNHGFGYTEVADELDVLDVPVSIQNAMELQTGETVWLIAPRDSLPESGLVSACGHWSEGVGLRNWFFYGEKLYPLQDSNG